MPEDLKTTLETLGLSQKEAAIYLSLLELGSSAVQGIARKAVLPRATVYDVLDDLVRRGLASTFEQRGVKHYTAENPGKMLQLANERSRLLEAALPQLQAIYRSPQDRPTMRLLQGREGMKGVLEEVLADGQEFMVVNSADDLFSTFDDYFPGFVERRVELNIHNRVILRDSPKARERKKLGTKELRQVRLIPAEYEFHSMKMIFGKKVALFTFYKDLVAVVVESEELAKLERAQFELLWRGLPA